MVATFFEVDGWEHSRLHQHDLLSLVLCRDHLVAHLPVHVHLAFRQLS